MNKIVSKPAKRKTAPKRFSWSVRVTPRRVGGKAPAGSYSCK